MHKIFWEILMLKNLNIGILFLQALLISDTSYDLEKLDEEEEAGEADDQSEEGKYQITSLVHNIFTIILRWNVILIWYLIYF